MAILNKRANLVDFVTMTRHWTNAVVVEGDLQEETSSSNHQTPGFMREARQMLEIGPGW